MPSVMRYVKLDASANPAVTIWDDEAGTVAGTDIDINTEGDNEIEWEQCEGQSGWVFSDIATDCEGAVLPNPPFTSVAVGASNITVKDDNEESSGNSASYNYQIEVTAGTENYWTDPRIVNRGG